MGLCHGLVSIGHDVEEHLLHLVLIGIDLRQFEVESRHHFNVAGA